MPPDSATPHRLIHNLEALKSNILFFDEARNDPSVSKSEYVSYVEKGICFVPYRLFGSSDVRFAPSRFLGYLNNDFLQHVLNEDKHGSETNAAITSILGGEPSPNRDLEQHYRSFCRSLRFEPTVTGAFGRPRRYWRVIDLGRSDMPRAMPPSQLFVQGQLYTRDSIAAHIGLDARQRGGGAWMTGYSKYESAFFIFTNVGSSGRTGHDYPNYWDGNDLIWCGKPTTARGQPQIEELLSGDLPVHIFWRSDNRASFTYAGLGAPVETFGARPLQVRWCFATPTTSPFSAKHRPHLVNSIWRRGPPPATGPRKVVFTDGPTSVYLFELCGPTEDVFPDLRSGEAIIKVGMSNDPPRRLQQLSFGFPPGCALRWQMVSSRQFQRGIEAFEFETRLIEALRSNGEGIGGEFATVSRSRLSSLLDL